MSFVLQLYFQDHAESLKLPYIDISSGITNYHLLFLLNLPFGFVHLLVISLQLDCCINRFMIRVQPSKKMMCIIFGTARVTIMSSCRPNDYLHIRQCFIPGEMMCSHDQMTMAYQDMQSQMRNQSAIYNRYIRALSTKWTHMNHPLFQPPLSSQCK